MITRKTSVAAGKYRADVGKFQSKHVVLRRYESERDKITSIRPESRNVAEVIIENTTERKQLPGISLRARVEAESRRAVANPRFDSGKISARRILIDYSGARRNVACISN